MPGFNQFLRERELRALTIAGRGVKIDDGADGSAIHDDTVSEISAVTEKTTPVAGDLFLMEDSEASNAKKRITYTNLVGQIHCSVDSTGGTTVDTTWRTVPFTSDRYSDTIYTRSGGEVTIDADCVLEVIATTCVKPTSGTGGARGDIQLLLQDDGGTGTWANISNAMSYAYTRENFLGSQLLIHQFIPWVSGEAIRMRIRDTVSGGPTQSIKGQTSSLCLRVVRHT